MERVLSVENMRKSDAYTIANFVPSKELMFRAGKGVYESVSWKPPVAVVCGSGNNAGDGYVIAKLLHDDGIACTIYLLSENFSEDGKYYFDLCKSAGVEIVSCTENTSFSDYGTIVDCILGTGFKGIVRGIAREIINAINESNAYIVSVDINSGLNGDSGIAELCVKSNLTVSVGGYKTGHYLNMAKDVIHEKINCDIGIDPVDRPYYLITALDLHDLFPKRDNYSNKGTYGYIALIGGSKKYSGAIRLAYLANAAMRSGAGVVQVAIPRSLYHDLIPNILESTIYPLSDDDGELVFNEEEISALISHVKVIAFGMGIGVSCETGKILEYIITHYTGKLIIDADGLTLLSKMETDIVRNASCEIILTPHIKEFARLTNKEMTDVLNEPIQMAEEYARFVNAVVLLKGPTTIITNGRETYLVDAGCSGMATAGSGDVLSGILAAICAYSSDSLLATAGAAYVNGKAGEAAEKQYNSISMVASDTVNSISSVISEIGGL